MKKPCILLLIILAFAATSFGQHRYYAQVENQGADLWMQVHKSNGGNYYSYLVPIEPSRRSKDPEVAQFQQAVGAGKAQYFEGSEKAFADNFYDEGNDLFFYDRNALRKPFEEKELASNEALRQEYELLWGDMYIPLSPKIEALFQAAIDSSEDAARKKLASLKSNYAGWEIAPDAQTLKPVFIGTCTKEGVKYGISGLKDVFFSYFRSDDGFGENGFGDEWSSKNDNEFTPQQAYAETYKIAENLLQGFVASLANLPRNQAVAGAPLSLQRDLSTLDRSTVQKTLSAIESGELAAFSQPGQPDGPLPAKKALKEIGISKAAKADPASVQMVLQERYSLSLPQDHTVSEKELPALLDDLEKMNRKVTYVGLQKKGATVWVKYADWLKIQPNPEALEKSMSAAFFSALPKS